MRAPRRWARAAVFALALACRLAVLAPALADPARLLVPPDSTEYVTLARNFAAGHGLSADASPPYHPDLRRTPIYPLFLAAVFRLPHAGIGVAAIAGALLGAVTAALTCTLGTELFGATAGLVAGLLLALDFTSIVYDDVLLTEGLFTCLLVWGAVWLVRRPATTGRLVGAAVLFGVALLCRPIALLISVALVPVLVPRASGPARGFRDALLVNVVCATAVVLWVARNAVVAGVVTFSSIGAVNLYFHRAAAVEARLEDRSVDRVRDEWQQQFDAASGSSTESTRLATLLRRGWTLIASHPGTYLHAYGDGLGRMASPDHEIFSQLTNLDRQPIAARWLDRLAMLQLFVTYAAAVTGLWFAATTRRWRQAMWVPLTFIAYFIITAGPEVYPRFRVPVMPFVVVLSGAGLESIAARVGEKRRLATSRR